MSDPATAMITESAPEPKTGLLQKIRAWAERRKARRRHARKFRRRVEGMRRQPLIEVLFVAVNIPCWKMDSLFRAMLAHPRFAPKVLLAPEMQVKDLAAREANYLQLRRYMQDKGYPLLELCDPRAEKPCGPIPPEFCILIYPKPYLCTVPEGVDYSRHLDRLLLDIHYAFHSTKGKWGYDIPYHELAWLSFFENPICAALAARHRGNKGGNVCVTGLPIADQFLFPEKGPVSPWKAQPAGVKRIIWAPHWTITADLSPLHYSNFPAMAEDMLAYARESEGVLQWAFKPHPLLKSTLYNHPDWGKEKTDAYYRSWAEGANTQLESGDYVDLFLTSDAMVHDSSSFCCEYHYTGKPVMFVCLDEQAVTAELNGMSDAAFHAQYLGAGMQEVRSFVRDAVVGGKDPMLPRRLAFRKKYLVPPHGRSAAENIIRAILGSGR